MLNIRRHRSTTFAALVLTAIAFSACDDDPVEVEEEPEIAALRLTVGTQVVTVDAEFGTVTGGPILISVGNANISAVPIDENGEVMADVTAAEFRFDVVSDDTGVVTFSRTSGFAGTLNGVAAGQTSIDVSLFHLEEMHNDFGEFPVPVTVQ
jgi:hypothetical protein